MTSTEKPIQKKKSFFGGLFTQKSTPSDTSKKASLFKSVESSKIV